MIAAADKFIFYHAMHFTWCNWHSQVQGEESITVTVKAESKFHCNKDGNA